MATSLKLRVGVIYKITYPNGKIYVGQDRTDDINYFGSADSFSIAKDFSESERLSFVVRKEILIYQRDITIQELNVLERIEIEKARSNDPSIGYNRTPGNRRLRATTVWQIDDTTTTQGEKSESYQGP